MNDVVDDPLMDEIMTVIASMNTDELTKFAELRGMTTAEYQQIIEN